MRNLQASRETDFPLINISSTDRKLKARHQGGLERLGKLLEGRWAWSLLVEDRKGEAAGKSFTDSSPQLTIEAGVLKM